MAIIDNAIYVDGVRTENPDTLSETFELMHARGGMGWIGLYRPSEDEIRAVAEEFGIHELGREVIDFQRATQPLSGMLDALLRGSDKYGVDEELQRYLRDVLDHALRIAERVTTFRTVLDNALTVESTIVARRQNEEMRRMTELSIRQNDEVKRISGWAAILFTPTLVGTVYGMNFDHIPELHWVLGYPMAIALMLGMGFALYLVFKRRGWL
ncbi:CorA family divalent cation transporter [Microbacterium sp. NPDC089696]|uniref:CorA family divalent cation transporter n=1 Tax=Microbacterium sp. NPDC089696 TaxID=3364199 RepID=UPI0038126BF0